MTSAFTFNLLKFDHKIILLQNNQTHKIYQYTETYHQLPFPVISPIIIISQPMTNGWVYEKELTTLAKQVLPKITLDEENSEKYFSEAELNNTFETILEFLQLGGKHGAIDLENILIDEEGAIRLKDPRLCSFSNEPKKDYENLGLIILQCALLKKEKELSEMEKSKSCLARLLKNYSTKLITNVWILLEGSEELKSKIDFTDNETIDPSYKIHYDEIEELRKVSFVEVTQKFDVFKPIQEKKVIVIAPALNIKLSKTKAGKVHVSGKKRTTQDENENEESLPKESCFKPKLSPKIVSQNEQPKFKFRKLDTIDNLRTPLKRKGKTSEKRKELKEQTSQF